MLRWSHDARTDAAPQRAPADPAALPEDAAVVTDLLFWFLVSQTVAGLPAMDPGTAVWVLSEDLLTVYARAEVAEGRLVFPSALEPGTPVRVSIFPPGMSDSERAAAASGATALDGRVGDDGRDLLVVLPELDGPLSMRKWLAEERGLTLVFGTP